jgi:hypothetical protein
MTETTKMIKAIANDSKVRIDRIVANYEQLEKENAELKEKLNFSTQYYQGEKAKEQLTKAKEIIKWFVWYFREGGPNLVPYKHKVEEAEQFLNSEVEK